MEGITDRLSDRELWESWHPLGHSMGKGAFWFASTPLGCVDLKKIDEGSWLIELGWDGERYLASDEESAIQRVVESYLGAEKRAVEAYVNRLKVNLGTVDEHGYVRTHTPTYMIRKAKEMICDRDFREVGRLDTYVLLCDGREIDKSPDYHVWEEKVTEAYQYELLKALNLR